MSPALAVAAPLTIVTGASGSRPRGHCLYMVRGAFEVISIQRQPFKHFIPPWYRMRNVKNDIFNIHCENLKLSGIHVCEKEIVHPCCLNMKMNVSTFNLITWHSYRQFRLPFFQL